MENIVQLVFKIIEIIAIVAWKSGFLVFMAWLFIYENTVGKLMPKEVLINGIGGDIEIISGLVIWAYILLNNIARFFTKNSKFSILKFLFSKKSKVGIVANLNLDTNNTLSGFVFGKSKGKYVTKKENIDGHILVIGGAGSGKSSCIAIPTLMVSKKSAFVIDVKGELYNKTCRARGNERIKVFNPTDPNANGYNPFYMLKYTDDLSSEVRILAMSICPLPADVKDPFWIKSSQNMLTGLLLYYYSSVFSFSEAMLKIKTQPIKNQIFEIIATL